MNNTTQPPIKRIYHPIDLHSHSTHSDGSLSVRELLTLVKQNDGLYQALTDHDTTAGIAEAREIANELGINLIAGVEISVTWHNNTLIHIVGLGIDENNPKMVAELAKLREARISRGQRIAANLAKLGIHGAFEGAMSLCDHPEALSRTHFGKWLVQEGHAKAGKAFDKYLAQGKPAYTPQIWASLEDAVTWIVESGGIAIIAHPGRYKLTRTKLLKLIEEFKSFGGVGIEVISSSHAPQEEEKIAAICRVSGLLASVGSDFHQTECYRTILPGKNKSLPNGLASVFPLLGIAPETYTILD